MTEGEPGEVYNLGSGEAITVRELLDTLIDYSGTPSSRSCRTRTRAQGGHHERSRPTAQSFGRAPAGGPRFHSNRACTTYWIIGRDTQFGRMIRDRDPHPDQRYGHAARSTGHRLRRTVMPKALITGITGQDGSYLAEFLLEKGYEVIGMVRRTSTENFERIRDSRTASPSSRPTCWTRSADQHHPGTSAGEVYNLAAQSFVPTSFAAGADRRVHRAGRHAHAGGGPAGRSDDPLLPGQQQRDVRQGAGRAAERDRRPSSRAAPTAWPRSTATGSR